MSLATDAAGWRRRGVGGDWPLAEGWLLLLSLLVLPGTPGTRAFVCLPCDESRCEEPKNCPGGVVLDICGCCFICARQRNESCGGFYGLHGACDRGLRCVIRPPLNGDSLTEYEAGVCEDENWDDQLLGFEPCNENLITGCNIINGKCECDTIRTCSNPFEFPSRDTCLSALKKIEEEDVENFDVTNLSQDVLQSIEADSFWCMSKLLDGIQDNYTFAQPGIQKKVKALEELVSRIDEQVHNHFRKYEVEYLQFAFRWMNNLLMRELPLRCTIRLWDTYQSEPEGFSHFHLYVCAAFLIKWRKEILDEEDFQGLLMLLQNLPTIHWGNEEIGLLLAEAYRLKYMFADAPNHYRR